MAKDLEKQRLQDAARSLLQRRTRQGLTDEDAREALNNLCGFFGLLREWAKVEDEQMTIPRNSKVG